MHANEGSLRKLYQAMSNDELVSMLKAGGLTQEAFPVLVAVIRERGVMSEEELAPSLKMKEEGAEIEVVDGQSELLKNVQIRFWKLWFPLSVIALVVGWLVIIFNTSPNEALKPGLVLTFAWAMYFLIGKFRYKTVLAQKTTVKRQY